MTKKYEDAFVTGFSNWKKAKERFQRHEVSECHKEAQLKLESMRGPNVAVQLMAQAQKIQAKHKHLLLKQLSSL